MSTARFGSNAVRSWLSLRGCFAIAAIAAAQARAQTLKFVDINAGGAQVGSGTAAISGNGRYVSWDDPNGHVYLRDTVTSTTSQVDLAWNGAQPNVAGATIGRITHGISDDGRYVIFMSSATNLVPQADNNATLDLFQRDRVANTTVRVSVGPAGQEGNGGIAYWSRSAMSSDGRFVAFPTTSTNLIPGDANLGIDVFRWDRNTGLSTLVSISTSGGAGNGECFGAAISASGTFVVFDSKASNLVASDTNGGQWDVFVRDMSTGTTTLESRSSGGVQGANSAGDSTISSDGRYIAFGTNNDYAGVGNTTSPIYVRDRTLGLTTLISNSIGDLPCYTPDISADGTKVAYATASDFVLPGHYAGVMDTYRFERANGTTLRISAAANGTGSFSGAYQGFPAISSDGNAIAFANEADNLVVPDAQPGGWDAFLWKATSCGNVPVAYCTAKINSAGCYPLIGTNGTPSASMASGFFVRASQVLNQKSGLFFYGHNGRQALPFLGGTYCVVPPVVRTAQQFSGGTATGTDCTGTYSLDFNVRIASHVDPTLVAGATIDGQFWSRDPGFAQPNNIGLTGGIEFVICP